LSDYNNVLLLIRYLETNKVTQRWKEKVTCNAITQKNTHAQLGKTNVQMRTRVQSISITHYYVLDNFQIFLMS
jgi:hypothetical protein